MFHWDHPLIFSGAHRFYQYVKRKAVPIGLMIGTTTVGLVSLVVSDLAIIRQFALLAGGLVIVTSLTHLIFAWAFYGLFPATQGQARPLQFFNRWQRLLPPTRLTFWGLTLLTLIGAICIPFIRLETEAAHYFHPEKDPIGQGIKEIGTTIFGHSDYGNYFGKNSTPWTLQNLEKLQLLENKLLLLPSPITKFSTQSIYWKLKLYQVPGIGKVLPLLSYLIPSYWDKFWRCLHFLLQEHLYRLDSHRTT